MPQSGRSARDVTYNIPLGVAMILLGAVCLTGMDAIFAGLIKRDYPVFMLQGLRNWMCVIALAVVIAPRWIRGTSVNPFRVGTALMLARGVLVYCTAILFFISLKTLDLGTVTTLLFFYPIVATFIAFAFLGEPIGIWRSLAIAMGLVGVIIAVQPGSSLFQPAALLPLVASVGFAVVMTSVRWVPKQVHSMDINFMSFLGMAVVGTPFMLGTIQPFQQPLDIALMLLATLFVVVGGQAITLAFRVAPIALVGALDYSAILFAVLFGFLLYGDVPGWHIWVAIPFIAGSGIIIAIREGLNKTTKV